MLPTRRTDSFSTHIYGPKRLNPFDFEDYKTFLLCHTEDKVYIISPTNGYGSKRTKLVGVV